MHRLPPSTPYHPLLVVFSFLMLCSSAYGNEKIVLAKNGGGDLLIENTLPAITLAASQGAQYIELQVNMTADNSLVVYRDHTLDRLTNAGSLFPDKGREDGNHYIVDLTLAELRQLRLKNVFENSQDAVSFGIPTLREAFNLIRKLESSFNQKIGMSIELVSPRFYQENGKDISRTLLEVLLSFELSKQGPSNIFIQCDDPDELQRLHNELFKEKQVSFPLIQIVTTTQTDENPQGIQEESRAIDYDWLFTNSGSRLLASYATALRLTENRVFSNSGQSLLTTYLEACQQYGIKLFLYLSENSLEPHNELLPSRLKRYYEQISIDGIYTDSFFEVQDFNKQLAEQAKNQAELPPFFSNLNLSAPLHVDDGKTQAIPNRRPVNEAMHTLKE